MHSSSVVMWYLRVSLSEREWCLDLSELASILLGEDAFCFKWDYRLSELIMRSSDGEVSWWIDLPKLTTLTTVEGSSTFNCPRSITLEGASYHSILTNRHALSYHSDSSQEYGFQPWRENRSHQESLSRISLISRHHSCSSILSLISCFFHTELIISTTHIHVLVYSPLLTIPLPDCQRRDWLFSLCDIALSYCKECLWSPKHPLCIHFPNLLPNSYVASIIVSIFNVMQRGIQYNLLFDSIIQFA